MKTLMIAVLAVSTFFAANSFAADFSGFISTKTLPKYVVSNGVVVHDKSVQQTDFFLAHASGFYADAWISIPWGTKDNFGKEIDWTLGWSGEVFKSGFVADVGVSYFDYIDLFRSAGDVINVYAKASYDITLSKEHTLTPYVKAENPLPVKDGVSGFYLAAGIKHAWAFSEKISLSQDALVLHDDGAYGSEKGYIAKYGLCAGVKVAPSVTIEAGLSAFEPITKFIDRKTEVVHSIGLTWSY